MSCSNTYDKAPTQVIGEGLYLLGIGYLKNPNLYINRHVICFSHNVKVYFDLCRMKAIFGLTNFSGEPTQA